MNDGILIDIEQDDTPEPVEPAKHAWFSAWSGSLLFGSSEVVDQSSSSIPWFKPPGLYFIVWRGMVCYIGQSDHVGMRIRQHQKEGRPMDRIAVILGVPKWAQNEIEQAYIRSWDTPWNVETSRSGSLSDMPELVSSAAALDASKVMPYRTPTVNASEFRWPAWRLQVREWARDAA